MEQPCDLAQADPSLKIPVLVWILQRNRISHAYLCMYERKLMIRNWLVQFERVEGLKSLGQADRASMLQS